MLSGTVCWNVLEEQLAHSRSSSSRIRRNIFDFAVAQQEVLREKNHSCSRNKTTREVWREGGGVASGVVDHMWMSSSHGDSTRVGEEETKSAVEAVGCHHSWINTKRSREGSQLHWDTVRTLGAVLDLSTHLHNYPTPLAPPLARFVVAKQDLYIPRDRITSVQHTWPGVCMHVCVLSVCLYCGLQGVRYRV